jgi:hypothetical protein
MTGAGDEREHRERSAAEAAWDEEILVSACQLEQV